MICSSCKLFITDPDATECPQCGRLLTTGHGPRAASYGGYSGGWSGAMEEAPRPRPFPSSGFTDGGYDDSAFDRGAAYGPPTRRPSSFSSGQRAPDYNPYSPPPEQMASPGWAGPGTPPGFAPPRPVSKKKRVGKVVWGVLGVLGLCIVSLGVRVALYALGTALTQATHTTNAAATFTPFPNTPSDETVIFQDTLASDDNQWSLDPAHCFYQDGAYHLKDIICYSSTGNIDDANIKVDAEQVVGPTTRFYGIVLRRVSKGNHYEFTIDSNSKWSFGKVVNDKYIDLVTQPSMAIKGGLNTTNTLLVRAKGSHFEFYVNGTKVGEADDTTFSSGRVGLTADANTEVAYKNFQITRSGG